jgi:hypothetical protein
VTKGFSKDNFVIRKRRNFWGRLMFVGWSRPSDITVWDVT